MAEFTDIKSREQLLWGIDLFTLFIAFSAKRGAIPPSQQTRLDDELGELAMAVTGEDSIESTANQLNHLINTVNNQFSTQDNTNPFPDFAFALEDHSRSGVMAQLDMIERTLTETAEAGLIDWEKESEHFEGMIKLFGQVEQNKMRPQEAMASLSALLHKLNEKLEPNFHFPSPNINAYE